MTTLSTVGKHATTVARDDQGIMRVTYHSTHVFTTYPNGRIDLDTGGWKSVTTKARMNQASNQYSLGFHVWQENFSWFVDVDGHTIPFEGNRLTIRNGHD